MTDYADTAASIAADAAETARVALAASLSTAKQRGTAYLVKQYGPGADSSSIALAIRAAAVLAGGDKPRGGAAQRITETIRAVQNVPTPTAQDYAVAARAVLDAHKEAERARRAQRSADRQAAKDILNDRGRSKPERIAALNVMTELDSEDAALKQRALTDRIVSALTAARNAGVSAETVLGLVEDVFPTIDGRAETLPAAKTA